MPKCYYCGKRIWFFQKKVYLDTILEHYAHLNCFNKAMLERLKSKL
jgi:hypothetical protein